MRLSARASRQGRGQARGLHPAGLREPDRLGHGLEADGAQDLVDELGGLPGPGRPHVGVVGAQVVHHGARRLDVRRVPARHDGQAAGLRARGPAGQRRVDPAHAAGLPEAGGEDAGLEGVDRGHVDQDPVGSSSLGDAARAEHGGPDDGGRVQAGDGELEAAQASDGLAATLAPDAASGGELGSVEVEQRDAMAAAHQSARDRAPHDADANHRDAPGLPDGGRRGSLGHAHAPLADGMPTGHRGRRARPAAPMATIHADRTVSSWPTSSMPGRAAAAAARIRARHRSGSSTAGIVPFRRIASRRRNGPRSCAARADDPLPGLFDRRSHQRLDVIPPST